MEEIRNEADALRACYEEFIEAAQSECGLAIHHVEATSRRNSCISVETGNGGSSRVPVLDICFRDESFQKVTDDRRQMTEEAGGTLRKLWQKVTVPYGMYFARKDYCDSRMYLHASDFEQKCFYDFISDRKDEIAVLLENRLGVRPAKLYTAPEGISIVYTAPDYEALDLASEADRLREEIYALADKYITTKYQQRITMVSYVRFLHPEMPGYSGYGLWLG